MIQSTIKLKQLARIRTLLEHFEQGRIPRLAQHEVHPGLPLGSRENYLYFTLPVCINFQRNSVAMWAAALKTYQDPQTQYLFFPEKLSLVSIEKIRTDLLKHKLALQPNKHVLIWTKIAQTLHEYYKDDPRRVLSESNNDATLLIKSLQTTNKPRFPYLCGPKLSNYWPYILSQFTDAVFTHPEEISIIPDTHVIQSSIILGLTVPGASSQQVEAAWRDVLIDSGMTSSQIHPVLWNWSRNKFMPSV